MLWESRYQKMPKYSDFFRKESKFNRKQTNKQTTYLFCIDPLHAVVPASDLWLALCTKWHINPSLTETGSEHKGETYL